MVKANLGAQAKILGVAIPILVIALIVHFIVFITRAGSAGAGFMAGFASFVGWVIIAGLATLIFLLLTPQKESIKASGSFFVLSLTLFIIGGLIAMGVRMLNLPFVIV